MVYTEYKDKLYLSDWDRLNFTVRFNYVSFTIGFELFHQNDKGQWVSRWFTIAGHHYYGETLVDNLKTHN